MIYFIQDTRDQRIKIGTSKEPWARLALLKCAAPDSLVMLAVAPGDKTVEAELHQRFASLHSSREWFRSGPDLLAYIAECRATHPQQRRKEGGPTKHQVEAEAAAFRARAEADPWFLASLQRSFMANMRSRGQEPSDAEHGRLRAFEERARFEDGTSDLWRRLKRLEEPTG